MPIRRFKLGSQIVVSKTPLLVPARAGPHLPIWRATTLKPGHVGLEFFSVGGNKAEAAMKYKGLEQIALEADVHPDLGMSRRERLERWVELLERRPHRRLSTIEGTEFGSRREREAKRADHSPLTVAFEDPVLRAAGLRGDRVGDAVGFFDLSHGEVHRLVCYCHHGRTVSPGTVAARLRMIAQQDGRATLSSRGMVIGGLSAAAALGLVFLAL
jgi:hypothetical protein